MNTTLPRRFALVRHDYTGVSGVGAVAFGVEFSDGHVVLRWCTAHPATSSWDSLEGLLAAHGEGTGIQWIDAPLAELGDLPPVTGAGRRARRQAAMTDGASAPVPATIVAEPLANGSPRPMDPAQDQPGEMAGTPHPPGRHRRASQLEQPV